MNGNYLGFSEKAAENFRRSRTLLANIYEAVGKNSVRSISEIEGILEELGFSLKPEDGKHVYANEEESIYLHEVRNWKLNSDENFERGDQFVVLTYDTEKHRGVFHLDDFSRYFGSD